ncbi:MAG: T9SS type A sorting domain-containing protein [Saprospiraceae bacterium]|nr:T9SS type A sorting domain-containing protein [Saprospiraceae bacterium]
MTKTLLLCTICVCCTTLIFAQKVFHSPINKTNISLRGAPVVLNQLIVDAPAPGKVFLRFDGECVSSPGDKVYLAVSNTPNWGLEEKSVNVTAIDELHDHNSFCHTMVYDIPAGQHTFYAVAENIDVTWGSGMANIYGNLTAEWFPASSSGAFLQHQKIVRTNFNVEGPPVTLGTLTVNAPTSGKIVARFDGMSTTSSGDLVMFAVNDNQFWVSYDVSASVEIYEEGFENSCFSHVRVYDVPAGAYTFYALTQNNYEVYGNGIASVFGHFTTAFYPEQAPVKVAHTPVNQLGTDIEGAPVNFGQITMEIPSSGQVMVRYSGTVVASFGDFLRMGITDSPSPNWNEHGASFGYSPASSDRNRNSFSHTRIFEVEPGTHHFNVFAENIEHFAGSGLAVTYADMVATFFPDNAVSALENMFADQMKVVPNPATEISYIVLPNRNESEQISVKLVDRDGRILRQFVHVAGMGGQIPVDLSKEAPGWYAVQLQFQDQIVTKPIIKL